MSPSPFFTFLPKFLPNLVANFEQFSNCCSNHARGSKTRSKESTIHHLLLAWAHRHPWLANITVFDIGGQVCRPSTLLPLEHVLPLRSLNLGQLWRVWHLKFWSTDIRATIYLLWHMAFRKYNDWRIYRNVFFYSIQLSLYFFIYTLYSSIRHPVESFLSFQEIAI